MNVRMKHIALGLLVVLVLAAGIGFGFWWGRTPPDAASAAGAATAARAEVFYWYDPMKPDQHFDKPGKSPYMDMQLVSKYASDASSGGVAIAPGVRQNLGIRTVEVKRGRLAGGVRVPGTITWDLRQERVVSARVDAIVERLYVKAPYESVRAGQPLASVLAPAWSTAMAEAQALGQASSGAARSLQSAAHERLRALGLPAGATRRGGAIVLSAPVSGVISEIGMREGQSAPAGTLLFRINGTRTVWLEGALPQAAVAGIAAGTPVVARVSAMPGRRFDGRVEALLPQLDAASRTQRARIVLDNSDGLLAPGMFAEIELTSSSESDVLLVPTDALIGGGREARVIVQDANDRFRPVAVQAGRSGGGLTEILGGLQGGERVVASGQFLIDSEANLSGALERLGAGAPAPGAIAPPEAAASSSLPETGAHRHSMPPVEQRAMPHAPTKSPIDEPAAPTEPAKDAGREVLYWYDPMHPKQHFDKPGKSPYMDMPLAPKYADEAGAESQP